MDNILIVITGLSLATAAGMGALLVRMVRQERRRSDARVALLEELVAEPPLTTLQHGAVRPAVKPAAGAAAVQPEPRILPASTPVSSTKEPATLDDFDLRPVGSASAPAIFQEHEAPSAWPRRFAVAGIFAALLMVVVYGWSAMHQNDSGPNDAVVTQQVAPPLELLSLQHAQQEGELVISGLVQNPKSGPALAGIQATVLLLGPDGQALTSGRAPLDFTMLAPGDESPFVIRVPMTAAVSRYRVGFRGEDDRVLAHVDRRQGDAVARKQAP